MITSLSEAHTQLRKIRSMATNNTYNSYIQNLIYDLTPTLDFILDRLEELESRQALTEALT